MMGQPRVEPLTGSDEYEKVRDLNSGTFGTVQLCRKRPGGEIVAVKFIERGEKISKYVEREIINHFSLGRHVNVVEFKEVFLTPHYLGIAMEYAPDGNMYEYVCRKRGLKEDKARWFFQQLIAGIDHCHRMGVANRDIKLENTLLDLCTPPAVKICDFGYSKHDRLDSLCGSHVGSPAYLAPEVVLSKTPGTKYDGKAVDVWSSGVMLYVMLVCAYPFSRREDSRDGSEQRLVFQRILDVDYSIPRHVKLSDECRDLLSRILVADPAERITIEQIYQHPWYTTNLPPDFFERMNNGQQAAAPSQSMEEIKVVIQEARRPGHTAHIDTVYQDTDDLLLLYSDEYTA